VPRRGPTPRAGDDVLELTDIPGIRSAPARRASPRPAWHGCRSGRRPASRSDSQSGNVIDAIPERRNRKANHRQTVEQVTPKTPGRTSSCRRPVCRGDHPHVHRARHVLADPADLAVLEGPEELGLGRADSSPPRRAPASRIGVLEESSPLADRACERARACPNNSASTRSSASARNERVALPLAPGLSLWMALATSSLPVPLSPSISTGNGVTAARAIAARRRTIRSLTPVRSGSADSRAGGEARRSSAARTAGAANVAAAERTASTRSPAVVCRPPSARERADRGPAVADRNTGLERIGGIRRRMARAVSQAARRCRSATAVNPNRPQHEAGHVGPKESDRGGPHLLPQMERQSVHDRSLVRHVVTDPEQVDDVRHDDLCPPEAATDAAACAAGA